MNSGVGHSLPHNRYHLTQGSPTSGLQTGTSCQTSGGVRLEIMCTINVIHLNHPDTIPPCPSPWKNCLPRNWSLVPKRLGTTDLTRLKYQVPFYSLIPQSNLVSSQEWGNLWREEAWSESRKLQQTLTMTAYKNHIYVVFTFLIEEDKRPSSHCLDA